MTTVSPDLAARAQSIIACGTGLPKNGVKYLGDNKYETQRYIITVNKGEVEIFDKLNKTTVKAWGDPHVTTGDGDKMQFQTDNLTLDLQDGTKLTLKPTAPDANGVSLIDSLAIMTPTGGELVENISTDPTAGRHFDSALELDNLWQDGTVLRAGQQVDDLYYASNGQEIVGGDANAKFGEHVLDGKGGVSRNDFLKGLENASIQDLMKLPLEDVLKILQGNNHTGLPNAGIPKIKALLERVLQLIGSGGFNGPNGPGFDKGFNGLRQVMAALMEALNRLGHGGAAPQNPGFPGLPGFRPGDFRPNFPSTGSLPNLGKDDFKGAVLGQIRGIDGQINSIKSALASGQVPKEQMLTLQLELQELQEMKRQLTEMLTSTMKSEHEAAMAVIRNLAV